MAPPIDAGQRVADLQGAGGRTLVAEDPGQYDGRTWQSGFDTQVVKDRRPA